MARPQSKQVHLYQKKGRPEWWARYSLPPDVARSFHAPSEIPEASRPPGADGRVAFSLHTTSKRHANQLVEKLQIQLTLAWEGKLKRQMARTLLDDRGPLVLTIDELFVQVAKIEAEKLALWHSLPTPQERDQADTIAPLTEDRYRRQRAYLAEALEAVYPGRRFYVHHCGTADNSPCDLRKIRSWLLHTRKLEAATYRQIRDYFSGHWKRLVVGAGLTDVNPWIDDKLAPPDAPRKARATLTAEQCQQIMALPSSWKNNALKLLLLTGTRPVELRWWLRNRYDANTKLWTVYQTKIGQDKVIPNTPDVAAVIADQLAVLDQLGLSDSLYLFPRYWGQKKGQPSTCKQMNKALTRAMAAAVGDKSATGLSISPYTFRRTIATARDRADLKPADMAVLLGHTNVDQQEVYRQLDAAAVYDSAARLQKAVKGA